jgi:DNA repair exonuclease SbcCD ATPase subunit
LQLPVQPQRQLIEELFNITLLSEKAVRLKEIIRETEKDIVVQAAVIKEQEGAINLYSRQLKEAQGRRDRWEQERAAQLSTLKEQLELLSSLDLEQERQLHEQVEELKAAKRERDLACSILGKDHRQLTKDVSALEGEVKHLLEDKCPYCLQRYAGAAEKLQQQEGLLEQKREQLRALSEQLGVAQADVTELTAALKELEAKLTLPSHRAVLEAKANRETIAHRLQELAAATNPHEEALALLEQHRPAPVAYERLDELKRDLEHQEFLLKLLTDKNSFIRRKIINRMIPFLNARLEHYTRSLGVTHLIRFDDNMTCTVSEYGRELDFGNLSSGEKKRVNFSLSLAFRDVLHHLHYRVNGLFIDEIDGSLDATGVEAIFKLLKQKTRDERLSLFIISHRPEAVGRFDRQLLIRKQNGFSRVINPGEEEGALAL